MLPIQHAESGSPIALSDGRFGDTNAPVFLDNVVCEGSEARLLDCRISEGHLGLIDDTCGLDLDIICPGMCGTIKHIILELFFGPMNPE